MGQEKVRREVVEEYMAGGVSLREVGAKWGIKTSTLHRWVKKYKAGAKEGEVKELAAGRWEIAERSGVPAELGRLRKELEEERLRNELLNTMIDIAEDQMGIDIRKKRGAKR
jgi:transposase